jgi:hypothetical protein
MRVATAFLDSPAVSTTRLTRHIRAPRSQVYRALLDPDAVQRWMVPDTEVVQVVESETDDPAMRGEMTISYLLADAAGGTEVVGSHLEVPPGVSSEDNETGWTMSMDKLPRLVEGG